MPSNVVLGAGIAGISAAYHLKQKGVSSVIFEKDNDWGGLCGFFKAGSFRFDRFVHFSFAKDEYMASLFSASSPLLSHPSISYNYYHGTWLKHPALNNLAPLRAAEKTAVISDFVNRPQKNISRIKNYAEWLRVQNGVYFAEHFPFPYTRKYWAQNPEDMETKWVGERIHVPSLEEVLNGAFAEQKQNFYYTKCMRYPKKGGFRSILDKCREGLDIRFNKKVVTIDTDAKTVIFSDGTNEKYNRLISTLPLPEMVKMVKNTPAYIKKAAENLNWTCGYQVSFGFKRADVAKYLWFYIYDEDIMPARVYSPSLKSPDNAPEGCSSLQAEVFFDGRAEIPAPEKVMENTLSGLKKICGFCDDDIAVSDIRFEPYANVTFTHGIYKNRKVILDYLKSLEIESVGRFGKWDYLWTHQAFESGKSL